MNLSELGDLHDATLESVEFRSDDATCRLVVKCHDGRREILLSGVTGLTVPFAQPWGHSRSINEATFDGGLKLELQSGDTIIVPARAGTINVL